MKLFVVRGVVLACWVSACSGPAAEVPSVPDEAPPADPPAAGPATTATIVGSCTIPDIGSCQTFYSDSPLATTAAGQCADAHGLWSDVCPNNGVLAMCVTLDGRPLAAFYPPQPAGDFGAGCVRLGGRLVE